MTWTVASTDVFRALMRGGFSTVIRYCRQIDHRSKRFDELDHATTLIRIGQRAAHGAGVVRHVAGIAGPGDHSGHTRVAEQIFQEKLSPGAREYASPVRQFLAMHCPE